MSQHGKESVKESVIEVAKEVAEVAVTHAVGEVFGRGGGFILEALTHTSQVNQGEDRWLAERSGLDKLVRDVSAICTNEVTSGHVSVLRDPLTDP